MNENSKIMRFNNLLITIDRIFNDNNNPEYCLTICYEHETEKEDDENNKNIIDTRLFTVELDENLNVIKYENI